MDHTIAAISTATGEAGIGIVRMSGKDSFEIGNKIFRGIDSKEVTIKDNRKMKYGHIYDGEKLIDEVLICFMKGPHTYTREDIVEIYTHGGVISVKKVLNTLLKNGAEVADRGEFTKRAFLNGRLDLSQAEAVIDMIKAKTDKAYDASLNQLEGSLKNKIGEYRDKMLNVLARLEYSINFTEDFLEEPDISPVINESEEVLEGLKKLYNSSNKGKIVREGIETAIIGKPNVGKSSLLNALIKEKKAIVTDIPGTTRDVVEEYIDLDGIALKISDTAGIRDTEDIVEKLGVDKSLEFIDRADLIIAMFDVSRDFDEEDRKIFNLIENKKAIVVFNKIDILKEDIDIEKYEEKYPIIKMSVKKDNGIEDLEKYIMDMFFKGDIISSNETLVTNVRHRDLIGKAINSLSSAVDDLKMDIPIDCIEVDIRETWDILGQITGDTVEDDILNKIFQDFCVGK